MSSTSIPTVPVRGEATPSYTHYPFLPDVPRRIHAVIPETKLIYVVRDPIDRIVAHWAQTQEDGDRTSLEEALADYDRPDHSLVCASKYATQLERYYRDIFAPEQLLVLDMHELSTSRVATIERTFRFLGVDESYRSPGFESQLNTRRDKKAITKIWPAPVGSSIRAAGRTLPVPIRRRAAPALRRLLSRSVGTPRLAERTDAALKELLRPEVARFRCLTGMEFATWSM